MICISCFHRYKRFMFPILSSIRFDDGITILEVVYLYMVENDEQNAMSKIKINYFQQIQINGCSYQYHFIAVLIWLAMLHIMHFILWLTHCFWEYKNGLNWSRDILELSRSVKHLNRTGPNRFKSTDKLLYGK